MLDEETLRTDDLCSNIEISKGFKVDWNLLFWPLSSLSWLLLFSSLVAEVCDQWAKIHVEQLFDSSDTGIENLLSRCGDVQIKSRIFLGSF